VVEVVSSYSMLGIILCGARSSLAASEGIMLWDYKKVLFFLATAMLSPLARLRREGPSAALPTRIYMPVRQL